jgi:alcohol dehydrogenase
MDTAKVTGAVLANPGVDVRAMEGVGKVPNPIAPLVVVPTTCGTGSEATPTGVITDTDRHYKMPIMSTFLYPRVALIDGALLTRLPAPVIASTGMDALCHALESYTNLNAQPISDCLDLQAIGMISRWLRPAVANANLEAMAHMVLASTIAGMGFANTRVTIVHAMSHPVSGYYGVPHGMANAILLPHVMEFNLIGVPDRFAAVARAMGEDTLGLTTMEAARLSVRAVQELNKDVDIPASLAAFGVDERHLAAMVEDTMKSGNIPLNPRRVSSEDIVAIYRRAMQ